MIVPVPVLAGIRATPGSFAPAQGLFTAAVGVGVVAIVAIVFGAGISVLTPLIRAWTRHIGDGDRGTLPARDIAARLERIEHAVDAIAVEVERISEGQRFVTQLLAKPDTRRLGGSDE